MSEENWKDAQSDFFESFRNYDEAGSLQRIQVLKYLVLTTMLMKSDINPFESQETKPYKNDPRIAAMTNLVDAYQRDDIHQYESVLNDNKDLMSDPFIAENIDEVTRNMRTKAVLKLIAPYTRFNLAFIGKALKIPVSEVQDILGFLIVDKKVNGKINQQDGTVDIEDNSDADRLRAMTEWTSAIDTLYRTVFADGEGFKMPDVQQIGNDDLTSNLGFGPGNVKHAGGPSWGGLNPGGPKKKLGKKAGGGGGSGTSATVNALLH